MRTVWHQLSFEEGASLRPGLEHSSSGPPRSTSAGRPDVFTPLHARVRE